MSVNIEEWRDVPGYEGLYQVSSFGRVKSFPRFDRMNRPIAGQIIKPCKNTRCYYKVGLSKNGKVKSFLVHRLVVNAFLTQPDGKTEVDHIDGDRKNNRLDNLRWVTGEENMQNPVTVVRVWNGIKKYHESLQKAIRQREMQAEIKRLDAEIEELFSAYSGVKYFEEKTEN